MYHKFNLRYTMSGLMLAMMLAFSGLLLPNVARTVFAQEQELSLLISGPSYVTPGSNITYELTIENFTDGEATDILIYNPLPDNTTYVNGGFFDSAENRVEFTLASLAAHTKHTFTLVVNVGSGVAIDTIIENIDALVNNITFFDGSYTDYPSENSVGTTVEAPGTLVAIYKNSNGRAFDVTVDGFGFDNYGNDAPRAWQDDLSTQDLFNLLGPNICQSGTTAQTCVLSGPAQKYRAAQLDSMDGGHCDGMASTSLRLFDELPFKGMNTPADFQSGASNTFDINFPNPALENYVAYYFITQLYDEVYFGATFKAGPVETVNKLKNDWNQADPIPYVLGIELLPNHSEGHAVTAYGIEEVDATESRILIYDNNYPGQRKYIRVDMENNTWQYTTAATPGETPSIYEGGANTGNLSIVDNTKRDMSGGGYFSCDFCNDTSASASAQTTAPGMVSGSISFQYTGEGAILVVDDEDQATGFAFETETYINEIPDAELLYPKGGLGLDIPPVIDVPYTESDETLYSVFVSGKTIDDISDGSLIMTGEGYAMGLDYIELEPDAFLELAVSPDGDLIAFSATETVLAPAMYISYDPIAPDDPSVIFEVDGVVLDAGEEVVMELDPDLERVYFEDTGALGQEFDVTMTLIWPDGDQEDYIESIFVPEGSTSAFIDFGAWDGLSHPSIYVDDILQNPLVNHRIKLESVTGTYDPTPQANAPAGVYHVEATFTNVTEVALNDVYFTVADLAEGNVVLNADGGPAGVGAEVLVPVSALGDNELLDANESFTFGFDVGLANADASQLTVDANGEPWDWTPDVDPPASYDANDESFVFAVATGELLASCGGYDVIQTTSGDIVAPGFTGNIVVGTDGADVLNGSNGDDLIVGLQGHDEIKGKQGNDILCGNEGQDTIRGGNGDDFIDGGAGKDWLVGNNGKDTIYGGAGADDLEGNNGADILRGGLGADVLLGGRDSDDLQGDEGQDYIAGGHHDDLIDGGLGRDLLYGDNGNDTIAGNDAGDELYGNKGDDTLDGGNGNDFCDGGKGTNSIINCEGASATSVQDEYTAEELSIRQELIDRAATHPAEDTLFLPLFTK